MFRHYWIAIRRIGLILGTFICLFFAAEAARLFLLLRRITPALGWGFAGFLIALVLIVAFRMLTSHRAHPRPLTAPPLPPLEEATHGEMVKYCRYLLRCLKRLACNKNLESEERALARNAIEDICSMLGAHPLNDDLRRAIANTESNVLQPAMKQLERIARAEVNEAMRELMRATALGTWPILDTLSIFNRCTVLPLRTASLYGRRPSPRLQLRMAVDTIHIGAAVDILGINRTLTQNLYTQLSFVAPAVERISRSLGVGLMTAIAGRMAIDRFSSVRGWTRLNGAETVAGSIPELLFDVRSVFKELLPEFRIMISSAAQPDIASETGFWDRIVHGVASAMDMTAGAVEITAKKPLGAGVYSSGNRMSAGEIACEAPRRTGRRKRTPVGRMARVAGTFGQRLKYTFFRKH